MTIVDIKSGAKEPWHPWQLALYCAGKLDPEVLFEEEGHRYTYRGLPVPSVTQILSPGNMYYAPGSAARGQRVHRMCVMDAQGVLDDDTVEPALKGYLTAWRSFKDEMVSSFIGYEEIVWNPDPRYAGRRDLSLQLKCPAPTPGAVLYLRTTGRYALDPYGVIAMNAMTSKALGKVHEYHEARRFKLWQ